MDIDVSKLIKARIESGLTTTEIKDRSGIARTTLSRIEKGKTKPNAKTLSRLCEVYGKPAAYFLKGGN